MAKKKVDKFARAAAARAALGIDDETGRGDTQVPSNPVPASPDRGDRVQDEQRGTERVPSKPAPRSSPRKQTSSERQALANKEARESGLVQVVKTTKYTKQDGTVIDIAAIDRKHWPKKHAPGVLKRGDSVWYRGERFYIVYAPSSWERSCAIRICNKAVRPDPYPLPTENPTKDLLTFCVHADLLDLAPTRGTIYHAQPTMAGLARKERAARGERDVGDEVAVLLRGASTLDDTYRIGAKYLGVPESDLRAKYGHLNNGQQRMNIGNRMRAKWKKDHR